MSSRNIPRQTPNTNSQQTAGQSLFNQLLEISQRLLEVDPELYKTAAAHLRDNAPREASPVRRAPGSEQKGVQGDHPRRSSNTFHKYNLPGDAGKREYYQCMICSERRVTNSFHADHQHEGQKLSIRWYCPLCDTLFAVTHRGYHIKHRHKTAGKKRKSRTAKKEEEESSSDSEAFEEEAPTPRSSKKPRREDVDIDNASQGSEDASASLLATIKPMVQQATITPATPSISMLDQPQPVNPPESTNNNQLTHTITQEALNGSAIVPSEIFRMESSAGLLGIPKRLDSSATLISATTSEKIMLGVVPATLS